MPSRKQKSAKKSADVVRAVDLVPEAFAEDNADTTLAGTLEYDLGHMAAFDAATVTKADVGPHGPQREVVLKEQAQARAQALVAQLWELPVRKTNVGPMASLPAPVTKLPRSLPLPAPKALTRWEQYAKEKGIVKRKRDRMVFDEEMQDFRPRYGFGRANDEMRDWVIDVKPGTDPMVDPFEARANAKKERIVKNKLSHIRNLERAAKVGPTAGIPAVLAAEAPRVAVDVKKTKARGPRGRSENVEKKQGLEVKAAKLAMAQLSTASIGKFDKVLDGEPARPTDSRKRRRTAVEQTASERSRDADVLRKVLGGSAYGRVEMNDSTDGGSGGGQAPAGKAKKGKAKGGKGKKPTKAGRSAPNRSGKGAKGSKGKR